MRQWFVNSMLVLTSVLIAMAVLKVVDTVLIQDRSLVFGGHYERSEVTTVDQREIYPYTGGHTQPDYTISPTFRTGDHGFMIDFDLDQPPAKLAHEFRLIMTGGSGAAGWGASDPSGFVSSVLEKKFRREASCAATRDLRVINLAMGGSQSYQNYIALNRWGHALRPDMILSYSGFNDMNVPWFSGGDGYRDFEVLLAYNRVARLSQSPDWLKSFGRIYPGLFRETALGPAIRAFGIKEEAARAKADYLSRFPKVDKTATDVVEKHSIPQYVHALRSMKRDFSGIPMAVAFQPYGLTTESDTYQGFISSSNPAIVAFNKAFRIDIAVGIEPYLELYQQFIDTASLELNGYGNREWLFLNPHSFVRSQLLTKHDLGDGVHFNDDVQSEIADFMAPRLFEFICARELSP